jgi:hypothetical protein
MIENKNRPAMPVNFNPNIHGNNGTVWPVDYYGLTKREYFAALAMQGLISNAKDYHTFSNLASDAVACADALLAELEK